MKKLLISKTRREFLELKHTKEDCQTYMKLALEEKGLKKIKQNELSDCLDSLSQESDDIMNLIKEQESILDRKSLYFKLPTFFIRSFLVKKKTKNMKESFVEFVQNKSEYSFEEYKVKNK